MNKISKKQLSKLSLYMSTFDGGVYRNKTGDARFIINMVAENRDYLLWVQETLENVTGISLRERKDYNTDGCIRKPQLRLESRNHPFFTKIRERIYINNHKVIDPHMLTLMDAEALAIIFMADGGSALDMRFKNPHCSITLNTKGFSHADNLALSKAIYHTTGIRTTVQKQNQYRYLRVKAADTHLFVKTVAPYLMRSFFYKFERIAPCLNKGGEMIWPVQ